MSLSLAPRSCWSFLDPPPETPFGIRVGVPGDWSVVGLLLILILLHERFLFKKQINDKKNVNYSQDKTIHESYLRFLS